MIIVLPHLIQYYGVGHTINAIAPDVDVARNCAVLLFGVATFTAAINVKIKIGLNSDRTHDTNSDVP